MSTHWHRILIANISAVILLALLSVSACQHGPAYRPNNETRLNTQSVNQCLTEHRVASMGTFFEMQLVHSCDYDPESVLLKVKAVLDAIESELSLYQPESELSKMNRSGQSCPAPTHLLNLLLISKQYFKKTDGAFDVTILPVLRSIENAFAKTQKPPKGLDRYRPLVNTDLISINKNCVSLAQKGMAISLDGIAKGYAVDIAATVLPDEIKSYLLNFSGNMLWRGRKPDGPWKIAVWNPVLRSVTPVAVGEQGAIASSGSENAHFDTKQKWHHIINPKTLRPPNYYASVTVLGSSAMVCDILSTSFATLELSSAKTLWQREFSEHNLWFIDFAGQTTVMH